MVILVTSRTIHLFRRLKSMHPLIRLVCFIIFAAFVSLGQYAVLILGGVLLLLIWLVSKQGPSSKAWRMLKRMKVFYFSILLIYLWFTPGEIIFSLFENWSPTYEGLFQALERILALCLLVFAVETLLRLTPRHLLLTGLYYLATPLVLLGLNRDQFIVRVILTLDLVSSDHESKPKDSQQGFKPYLNNVTQRLADKITDTIHMKASTEPMTFELQAPPNMTQWMWPLCLLILFLSVS